MPTNRLTRRLIYRPVCLFSNTIHTTVLPHLNNSINARVVACLFVVTGEVHRPRRPQAARLVGTVWATTLITVPFSHRGCNSKHQLSRELLFPVKFRTIHSVVDGYYFSSLILHQKAFHKLYSCWTVERFSLDEGSVSLSFQISFWCILEELLFPDKLRTIQSVVDGY